VVENVAVIGFGSGLSTHTFLSNPEVAVVDTIEIEPEMVAGAKAFQPINGRAFTDPRSYIYIDDAKSYFTSTKTRYDIILAEPSNPWVSGVANLFSAEFYHLVSRKLTPDGKFVQWLQLYESNSHLLASVIKALKNAFPYFDIYSATGIDLVIVASMSDRNRRITSDLLKHDQLRMLLNRVGVAGVADLEADWAGNEVLLYPFFADLAAPENSDYFPYVDQHAVKARYLQTTAAESLMFISAKLPILQMLAGTHRNDDVLRAMTLSQYSPAAHYRRAALNVYHLLTGRGPFSDAALRATDYKDNIGNDKDVLVIDAMLHQCRRFDRSQWLQSLLNISSLLAAYLTADEFESYWHYLENSKCYGVFSEHTAPWLDLFRALGAKDAHKMLAAVADIKSTQSNDMNNKQRSYVIAAEMLALYALEKTDRLITVWRANLKHGDFDESVSGPITALALASLSRQNVAAATEKLAAH